MVYVTGDCHADWSRFSMRNFPDQKDMTRDDIVIVCGDFGLWHDDARERHELDELAKRSFTLVFVDGNHENFDRLYSDEFPVVDFHGGKAHKIRDNIYHLMRGYVFTFDGKKFWAFGGASSHDIQDGILDPDQYEDLKGLRNAAKRLDRQGKRMYRIKHLSWWEQEMPSMEERQFGLRMLQENGNKVDYIITHCAPQEIASICGFRDSDELTRYFDMIKTIADFDAWYFGHYHKEGRIYSRFNLFYEQIMRII